MQVYWVSQEFFFIQNDFKILVTKKSFLSDLKTNVKISSGDFVFCGGVLNNEVIVWAKPGILKEEYILFFEYMQPFIKITCNEMLSWAFKCIQHALSLKNNTVAPALNMFANGKEILMDEF